MNLYHACRRFVEGCPQWSWPALRFGLPLAVALAWLVLVGWPAALVVAVAAVLVWVA